MNSKNIKRNIIRIISILMLIATMYSCEKQEDLVPYNLYRMKSGNHYSTHLIHELRDVRLTYDVIFDPSCVYTINAADQADINKLFGFSECNDQHHENSARFGWRWYKDSLQILGYCYNEGVVATKYLASVPLEVSHQYTIEMTEDSYYFTISGKVSKVQMKRTYDCNKGLYYILFPYFGGNNAAPHDVDIYMRRIY